MSINGFQDILLGPFATYLVVSQQIGGVVVTQSALVQKAFQAQLQYLIRATQTKTPTTQSEQMVLLHPTSQHISTIQDFREKHRNSMYFNHLSAVSESVAALGWVAVRGTPAYYVKKMTDICQFYTNRILKDWKEKDQKHVEWVEAWIRTLSSLQKFIKQYHTTGLIWSGTNQPPAGKSVPTFPPQCPTPPPFPRSSASSPPKFRNVSTTLEYRNNDRSALFAEINQGENIVKSLKKVPSEMKTYKNRVLTTPFKISQSSDAVASVSETVPIDKLPVFTRNGKKWFIEYQKGNKNIVVQNTEMNHVVYLYKCLDSTVVVKGKINSITLDSCKRTCVLFDSLVSVIEFINCHSVQMQVLGKVPTICVEKTHGCQMYLSPESLEVEIMSSQSSEMNVLVPKLNGDYMERPLPEQFRTTVTSSGLRTVAVEPKS